MKFKYILTIPAIIAVIAVFITITRQPLPTQNNPGDKITIAASFYPLADFAKNIGGEFANVISITPAGAEPHEFEPTPQDMVSIYDADLFILNGQGLDTWAEKIIPELQDKNIATIKMSDRLETIKSTDSHSGQEQNDPHFWLDINNASKQADLIADALIKIDSVHTTEYNKNRDTFKQQLFDLDQEFKSGLANCKSRELVTTHNAFAYLANRYNLTTFHILGLSPEEEPSAKQIAAVADLARSKNIKYIFFETAVDQKLSRTIADEIGAQTLVLNPLEGLTKEEINAGQNYISVMKNNLENLKTALVCL